MPSTGSSTLRKGSVGERVKGLQQALKDLGYSVGLVDGQFGPKTHEAVKAF
jgi:peptidoglycan hydrolase-like protein with peptidoglycan-binding domain